MANDYFNQFKILEKKLQEISRSGDSVRFRDMLDKAGAVNLAIDAKKDLILDLYALRNIFAHKDREKYIADVNQMAFDSLKEVLDLISNPPKAGTIFKTEVYCAHKDDITENLIRSMRNNMYTHVPTYSDGWNFCGVISEASIFNWLADSISHDGRADFYKKQVKDMSSRYLEQENDACEFVSSNESIFAILRRFNVAIQSRRRLGVILITESGDRNEKPVGIVTAWDLPRIQEYL